MPEDIRTPITKVLLKENDNLAVILPINVGKDLTFKMYFFRVMRRHLLHRDYTKLTELKPGDRLDLTFLGGTGTTTKFEDSIFAVWEERPFRILHFAIGIKPSNMWLYIAQPADVIRTGFAYETSTKVGDPYDYVDGHLSPYDNPTIAAEVVQFYKMSIQIGIVNKGAFRDKPVLKILGAGYDCIPITDEKFIGKMLAGIKPVRYVTIGGLSSFPYTVPEEWGKGVVVNKEVIEALMAGEVR